MGDIIKARKGLKASIDPLLLGEFGFTTDEERVYIGGNNGNIPLPNAADLSDKAKQVDLNTHTAKLVTDTNGVHGLKIESGTFTPFLADASENLLSNTLTYGKYEKTGKKVVANFKITITSISSASGYVYLKGLPFSEDIANRYGCSFNITVCNNINVEYIVGEVTTGVIIPFIKIKDSAITQLTTTNIPTSMTFNGTVIYYTV